MRLSHLVAVLGLVTLSFSAACSDVATSDESNITDSFAKPTLHGELAFGTPNQAAFTSVERFHGWTFTLTDSAKVVLGTELFAENLDSEMYLYRRDAGSTGSWGASIAKNDDAGGQLASRIERTLDAGEYLVKVKAKKTQLRGAFAVNATCDGDGCPQGGVCADDTVFETPAETGFAPSCAGDITGVLATPTTGSITVELTLDQQCDGGSVAARAANHYRDYWADFSSLEDLTGEANPTLNVSVHTHGTAGYTAEVDVGGDEDLLYFVFDASENLLAFYHSEQSPTERWFCADAGEQTTPEPDTDCMSAALWSLRHAPSAEKATSGSTSASNAATLGPIAGPVVKSFATSHGLSANADIAYDLVAWSSVDGDDAIRVTLTAAGTTTTYFATDRSSGTTLLLEDDGSGPAFVCNDL